mmetsp:Transcript_13673/g.29604  ORF Transcript_13673/g.29604 Transcript_13673/m.29604 type:complete len:134 (-) Transcript_13673:199-600(-)
MRGYVLALVVAGTLCVSSGAPVTRQELEGYGVESDSACVNNATHCSCVSQVVHPILMVPDTKPAVCYEDPLEDKAYKCDCAGTELCTIEEFPCTKLKALGTVIPNQRFYCEKIESDCRKATVPIAPNVFEEFR